MTAVDSEIDKFIRQEKAKLASERQALNLQEPGNYYQGNARRRWGPPVDLDSLKNAEKENYRRTWYDLKGKFMETSSNRRPLEPPLKLSPRGVLDTGALILDVQKEREQEDYEERWRRYHGGQVTSSRVPINQVPSNRAGDGGVPELRDPRLAPGYTSPRTQKQREREEYKRLWQQQHPEGRGYRPAENVGMSNGVLDVDQIIREVQREKMEEEERLGAQNVIYGVGRPTGAAPGRGTNPAGLETTDEYRRLREHQNARKVAENDTSKQNMSVFADSQQNIENKIAEAKQEADDYRKRWESQHTKASEAQRGRQQNYGVLIKDDERLGKMKELRDERNREYNEYLARKRVLPNRPLREQTDEYKAFALEANESDAAKLQKIKERNEEYNKFLAAKSEKDRNRFLDKKAAENDGIYATIPGLRYSTSAQRRVMAAERNREYNEMMRQKTQNRTRRGTDASPTGPKQGWSTPTYEEMLDKKRAQELNYRRANDTAYETSLHAQETERRIRELEKDLAVNPLDHAPGASELVREQKDVLSRLKDFDSGLKDYQGTAYRRPTLELGPAGQQGLRLLDPRYDKLKRQEEYKRDLQQQMADAAFARMREKEEGLQVNDTGIIKSEPKRVIFEVKEPRRKDPAVEAYHTKILDGLHKLDEISPRSNAILGRGQPTADRKTFGGLNLNPNPNLTFTQPQQRAKPTDDILDLGLAPIIEPVRLTSLDPPPGLQYQPTTYVTANTVPNLNNSVDEAYSFYAAHNLLNPHLGTGPSGGVTGGGGGGLGGDVPVPSLDLSRVGRDGGHPSKVHFRDGRPQEAPAAGMQFGSDEERKRSQREQQKAYREELERQMLEKNIKKMRDKDAQERYDLKMEQEAKTYDPFGKGGGGAPMRDQQGNVITDLRQMRYDNNNRDNFTPRDYGGGITVGHAGNTTRTAPSYRDDLIGPPPAQTTADGETTFARGGHGIFGMPKTDAEKMQADKYKMDLKRQMEEKKAEEYRRKHLEKLEEEREQKILEEQRAKMQREFEEEQRKIREKEEEMRRRNEEMIRAAEEKKRDAERRKLEAEELKQEQRQQELREERERELRERNREVDAQGRGKSPVVPALRGKQQEKQDTDTAAASPPVPAVRSKTVEDPQPFRQEFVPRAHSADVLNQLAHMRAQLQNERRRVQTLLNEQEDDVEIYDPRTAVRPGPALHSKPDMNVFDTAMNGNAVAVRRSPGDKANPQAAEDFSALKHKNDSDSRRQFRQMFPDEPVTGEALETQQAAFLRQQEERLHGIRDGNTFRGTSPHVQDRDTRSSSSQLHSKSAFVDVNGIGPFPDDFEDMPHRNDSARSRRRTRASSSPRFATPEFNSRTTFGSQTSLNVDKIARKNEDRLKKLRDMQGDDLSLYDPEDVLERFMSKQGHNRPPSGKTLLDDTWTTAANRNSNY